VIVAIGRGHIAPIYQYFHAGDDAMSSTSPGTMRCTRDLSAATLRLGRQQLRMTTDP
jgi:hypothetical protein